MNYEEKIVSRERKYDGNIISVDTLNVLLPNGKESTRDLVVHTGASVVIPMTSEGDVYLVKQYRSCVETSLLELPAGKLDLEEEPINCAYRELKEETGLEAKNMKHLTSFYSAPGFSNEILHLYIATEFTESEQETDEDEFLSVEKIHINKLVNMIITNEITDGKTIMGILLAEKIFKGQVKI
jgi:ADP-ribose pyrophosphatase